MQWVRQGLITHNNDAQDRFFTQHDSQAIDVKILVQHLGLINVGLNISVDVGFHQILIWDVSAEKASCHLSASGALPAGQIR